LSSSGAALCCSCRDEDRTAQSDTDEIQDAHMAHIADPQEAVQLLSLTLPANRAG
jgi:hypothetical protein